MFALLKIHRYGELIGAKDVEIREEMDNYRGLHRKSCTCAKTLGILGKYS